ncbi:MAG: acyloxyacyl hydrolase [bacterium]|nr:acyloxyacyl hydrolase [bacterium]
MRSVLLRVWCCVLITGCLGAAAPAARGLDPEGWAVSVGSFDVSNQGRFEAGLEYRLRPFRLKAVELTPAAGIAATQDGSVWIYGGLRWDLELSEHWILTPHTAFALYEEGDGKDLGGPAEFRSGLELAFRFAHGSRIGLSFYHLSNAEIYDHNPGSNTLMLTWSLGR